MSVSSCCFKSKVVLCGKVVLNLAEKAYSQEKRANDNVESVEARGYEES